jgi:CDP-glucose 4,6-dehydratase
MTARPSFNVWKNRRVLVTGHTGFKGGWLAAWLGLLGAEVSGFALAPDTDPNLFGVLGLDRRMRSILGDVRDAEALAHAVAETRPEVVFHLAAQPLVRRSYRCPSATFAVNVQGTVNLLEAIRAQPSVKAVLVVTSDKVYANDELGRPFREGDPLGGHDPYSASKACAEIVCASWRDSFLAEAGILLASARAGNVIGGGDWSEDRLVPDIARTIGSGRPVVLRNPDSVRPWQHVLDATQGYLNLAARLLDGDRSAARGWNFGPGAGLVPVREVANTMIAAWGQGSSIALPQEGAPHEAALLMLDSSEAGRALGWMPVLSITEALHWTAEWYRAHAAEPAHAAALTQEQLQRMMDRLSS